MERDYFERVIGNDVEGSNFYFESAGKLSDPVF
jgi:hypothetical protein